MRRRAHPPPGLDPENLRPNTAPRSWLAEPSNRLILTSAGLILFSQTLIPPDGAPPWLNVL